MRITSYFKTPKSWTKKKTAGLIHRAHTQVPDLDNLAKAICDGAANSGCFANDSQIAWLECRKLWSNEDKTIVQIGEFNDFPVGAM